MQLASTPTRSSSGKSSRIQGIEPRIPLLYGRSADRAGAHERHAGPVETLRALCDAIQAGRLPLPTELDPGPLLSELRRELTEHIATEESEAHFGVIARVRPELLPFVVDLKADHAAMLGALARLELIAGAHLWDELPAPLSNLVAMLRAHDQAEADLIQSFLAPSQEAAEHLD